MIQIHRIALVFMLTSVIGLHHKEEFMVSKIILFGISMTLFFFINDEQNKR